ncbi:MAG: U32 family peptidase [Candidatus Lokiarchaeota archaeon]|nr:U32 family peptidase [Candidatus Lokiarchaeota archaeon]
MKKVELLAPLKNQKSLNAVIGKADAVYFGVESLNMRAFSDNFKLEDLPSIVKKCHDNTIKAYLTTNVIVYENEFDHLYDILAKAARAEIDSVIVHDIGVIQIAKELGIKFHISTQANISNTRSALFYESLGSERLILARELSLDQIKHIKSKLKRAQIEIFVHGAQCTSISGRCYFSAEICGSQEYSANRGKCVQPCRRRWRIYDDQDNELLYDGFFFINTKDLCMIEHIPDLINTNVDAFKIEGRMRDSIYIEETTACYREAIDAYYDGNYNEEMVKSWIERLSKVYNRGFSTGFYYGLPKGSEISQIEEGNVSSYRKREIGRVLSYFRDKNVAKILLTSGKLRLQDVIFIIGAHTDTYLRQNITSIQIKQKQNLTETPIASKDRNIVVGIKVDKPVKKNDKIYVLDY